MIEAAKIDPDSLRITVTDDGTGIAATDIDRIFEPFFTTKEVGSGTGLGLSVSFGIISSMGGQLQAGNGPEGGAQFVITLPQIDEAPEMAEEFDELDFVDLDDDSEALGRHLLLVDDEPQAIEAMATYLIELGYRVSRAHSGNSAFKLFQQDPADLVLTDVRMPDGDGEDLVKRLRGISAFLPIIVATGHIGTTESLEAETDPRRMTIVKKPISLAALAETIERMLSGR